MGWNVAVINWKFAKQYIRERLFEMNAIVFKYFARWLSRSKYGLDIWKKTSDPFLVMYYYLYYNKKNVLKNEIRCRLCEYYRRNSGEPRLPLNSRNDAEFQFRDETSSSIRFLPTPLHSRNILFGSTDKYSTADSV